MYILKFITTNKEDESDVMKLYSPDVRYYPGSNFITEAHAACASALCSGPPQPCWRSVAPRGRTVCRRWRIAIARDKHAAADGASRSQETRKPRDVCALQQPSP